MNATQTKATEYGQQLEKQGELATTLKDRDDHLNKVVRKIDDLNQAVNDKEQLRKRMAELAKDLTKSDKALKGAGKKDCLGVNSTTAFDTVSCR